MGCNLGLGCGCFRSESRSTIYDYDSSSLASDVEELPKNIPVVAKIKPNKCTLWKRQLMRRILCCFQEEPNMTKLEKTVKATLLIQRWFRRYMARLELRRRYTWNIFQSLEYAGEQDQVKLYNFFNALLTHIPETSQREGLSAVNSRASSMEELDMRFDDESENDDELELEEKDRHFKLTFPLTEEQVKKLMEIYKTRRHFRLHAKVLGELFKHCINALKKLPNLNTVSTGISKQVTVCGDLHGKFDDLLVIFHKNGLPSNENPYVFNGDFVDRGRRGLEVLVILLCFFLLYPNGVYLNRGNHEDHIMNTRYGFIREVQCKYRRNSEKLLKLIEGVYRWLPLGSIINSKVLVVHGGVSDTTDLDLIATIDREKYVSLLRPPLQDSSSTGQDPIDKLEWKQVFDILWSDPQAANGCIPNGLRGAGTYFGPDVTKSFLERHKLQFLIRSHECKLFGYEVAHENKLITIFSASNYYEIGSNKGAYVKLLGPDLETHFVQYTSPVGKAKALTFYQRIGVIESSAIRELHAQIISNKTNLENEFVKFDPDNTGFLTVSDWCKVMETATGLELPWRMLREKLVTLDTETQLVKYSTTLENIGNKKFNISEKNPEVCAKKKLSRRESVQGSSTVLETLYKNKSSLEAIFKIIDKDNSGHISLDEFSEACNLIKEHMPNPITHEQLVEICRMMDLNKDGLVDLNEFLESFRMADLGITKEKSQNVAVVESEPKLEKIDEAPETSTPQKEVKVEEQEQESTLPVKKEEEKKGSCVELIQREFKLSESHHFNDTETPAQIKQLSVKSLGIISPKDELLPSGESSLVKSSSENDTDQLDQNKVLINKNSLLKSPVLSIRRGSQI